MEYDMTDIKIDHSQNKEFYKKDDDLSLFSRIKDYVAQDIGIKYEDYRTNFLRREGIDTETLEDAVNNYRPQANDDSRAKKALKAVGRFANPLSGGRLNTDQVYLSLQKMYASQQEGTLDNETAKQILNETATSYASRQAVKSLVKEINPEIDLSLVGQVKQAYDESKSMTQAVKTAGAEALRSTLGTDESIVFGKLGLGYIAGSMLAARALGQGAIGGAIEYAKSGESAGAFSGLAAKSAEFLKEHSTGTAAGASGFAMKRAGDAAISGNYAVAALALAAAGATFAATKSSLKGNKSKSKSNTAQLLGLGSIASILGTDMIAPESVHASIPKDIDMVDKDQLDIDNFKKTSAPAPNEFRWAYEEPKADAKCYDCHSFGKDQSIDKIIFENKAQEAANMAKMAEAQTFKNVKVDDYSGLVNKAEQMPALKYVTPTEPALKEVDFSNVPAYKTAGGIERFVPERGMTIDVKDDSIFAVLGKDIREDTGLVKISYDSNHDGIISKADDSIFAELKNGVAEFKTSQAKDFDFTNGKWEIAAKSGSDIYEQGKVLSSFRSDLLGLNELSAKMPLQEHAQVLPPTGKTAIDILDEKSSIISSQQTASPAVPYGAFDNLIDPASHIVTSYLPKDMVFKTIDADGVLSTPYEFRTFPAEGIEGVLNSAKELNALFTHLDNGPLSSTLAVGADVNDFNNYMRINLDALDNTLDNRWNNIELSDDAIKRLEAQIMYSIEDPSKVSSEQLSAISKAPSSLDWLFPEIAKGFNEGVITMKDGSMISFGEIPAIKENNPTQSFNEWWENNYDRF